MDVKPKSEAEQLALFEAFRRGFKQAIEQVGEDHFFCRLADTTIRISFAGPSLVPHVTPALEHLRVDPEDDFDLTLCLWDSASTGILGPPPSCPHSAFTDRGDIWGFNSKRIKTAFHWSDYSVNLLDHQRNLGFYWVADADTLPYWADASPLRTLFHWWFERHGGQLVHGAAVGTEDGAVLITGKGGVGKSTSALSCLDAGLHYLGDDYVIIRGGSNPSVCCVYCTAKLNADHLSKFPRFERLVSNPDELEQEKAVIYLHSDFAHQIRLEMPLKAILTPRVGDAEETTVLPSSPLLLRQAISFTTMSQLPYVGSHTHEFFEALKGFRIFES